MVHHVHLWPWVVAVWGWTAVFGLTSASLAAAPDALARGQVKVMIIFKDIGGGGIQPVENTLARAFQRQGYTVLDPTMAAQTLRREADLLQVYEIEAAKRLGSRLGADIVVSGESMVNVLDRPLTILGGKSLITSQADLGAKAILVSSGKVLAAENAQARKPFDSTGASAQQAAAEMLAGRLTEGIEQFLKRDTVEYRLVVFNIKHSEATALQQALPQQIKGVRQVIETAFSSDNLELEVRVAKAQDGEFKQSLFNEHARFGSVGLDVVAREGGAIYLRKAAHVVREFATPRQPPGPSLGVRRPPEGPRHRVGYRKSWAVVIGINDYRRWPKLAYAVNDARSMGQLLKKIGFDEVITLTDGEATQHRILQVLGDDLYAKTDADDRVFIFFAGHGQTQDLPDGGKVGYIIPVEGDLNWYYSTAISMRQLQDISSRLRAKHIFYAIDACFSGLLLRLRGQDGSAVIDSTTAPARQVLTAGGEGEKVVEVGGHGLFTRVLLDGLQGAADLNRDGNITASELSQFVTQRVVQASGNTQNPVFGRLEHGEGEFLFVHQR